MNASRRKFSDFRLNWEMIAVALYAIAHIAALFACGVVFVAGAP